MSKSIDERVVEMKFKNSDFEKNTATTMSTLDKLKNALKLEGAAKGLDGIKESAKGLNLGTIADGIQGLSDKFSALSVMGIAALGTIASKAVDTGLTIVKSLTIDPIMQGFNEYELKMGSIQTMLANTERYGTKLPEVTAALDELNAYADKTIYNFGDMTKNIGLFTNAGIKVEDATQMIKGFSNVAAASGTSAQGAASAAYQLSQALSAGTIRLMDWRSLTNAGMGNKNMQNGLIEIADAMGTLSANATSATEVQSNFNGSLEKNWLSADVMSNYLRIMAGDMSDAEMAALGLSDAQIQGLKQTAATAEEAATKVRTWTQLLGTLAEGVGSGWSQTFELILGDFNEATDLFTGISDTVGGIINGISNQRNQMLQEWKDLGGRDDLLAGLKNVFEGLMGVIKPIHEAFRTIFPPTTGQQLATLTKGFLKLTEFLKIGETASKGIKTIFIGLFSVMKVGVTLLEGVGLAVVGVVSGLLKVGQGFLAIVGAIGGAIAAFANAIHLSERFQQALDWLSSSAKKAVGPISDALNGVAKAISYVFSDGPSKSLEELSSVFGRFAPQVQQAKEQLALFGQSATLWFNQAVESVTNFGKKAQASLSQFGDGALEKLKGGIQVVLEYWNKLTTAFNTKIKAPGLKTAQAGLQDTKSIAEDVKTAFNNIVTTLKEVFAFAQPLVQWVTDITTAIANKIRTFVQDLDFQDAVALLNTTFFILLYKAVTNFMDKLSDIAGKFGKIADSITGVFDQLTEHLKTMQQQVKADIIMKIAIAVGLLAAALFVLSKLDVKSLAVGLGGITAIFVELAAMMLIINKLDFTNIVGAGKAATALLLISAAVLILSIAVKDLAQLSWDEMARGLIATGVLLAALALFTKFAEADGMGISSGAGIVLLAGGLLLMSIAVSKLGQMDTGQLIKGVLALSSVLAVLALFTQAVDGTKIMGTATAIGILGVSLLILAGAIILYSKIDWETLGKGLLGMAAALVTIGVAMHTMPTNMLANSVALVAVGVALLLIAGAMKAFGSMEWEAIGKGLVVLAASLLIISAALVVTGSPASLAGAAAILIIAAAFNLLVPAMMAMSLLSWEGIAKGLTVLAVSLLVIAGVAIGLSFFSGQLIALGAALLIMAAAVALAGVGIEAFAKAIAILAATGAGAVAAITALIVGIAGTIPLVMEQIGLGIRAFAKVISESGPELMAAMVTLLTSIIQAIAEVGPQIIQTLADLLTTFILTIMEKIPIIVEAGMEMILAILQGIRDHIGEIVTAVGEIIVVFLDALAVELPRIIESGTNLTIKFIEGIGSAGAELAQAAFEVINQFISDLTDTINEQAPILRENAMELGRAIVNGLTGGLLDKVEEWKTNIGETAQKGIDKFKEIFGIHSPSAETTAMGQQLINGLVNGVMERANAIFNALGNIGRNALDAIRNIFSNGNGSNIGSTLVSGLASGFNRGAGWVWNSAVNISSNALQIFLNWLSSSQGYGIGGNIVAGIANGIWSGIGWVTDAARSVASRALNAAKSFLGIASPSKEFFKVGVWSDKGFAGGLDQYSGLVENSAEAVGANALDTLRDSMSQIRDKVTDDIDMNPTITPVLDLSQITNDANKLSSMLNTDASYSAAARVSGQLQSNRQVADVSTIPEETTAPVQVNFTQNNTSPKALSDVEIYRQTNNLLNRAYSGAR